MLDFVTGMMNGCNRFDNDMTSPMVNARVRPRWRVAAALLALSIGAAACGSTETSSTPTLATQEPAATEAPTTTGAPAAEVTSETAEEVVEQEAVEAEVVEEEAVEEEEAVVNLFPDIDVLNIADGATVNLAAELGGADKATLLWFFAPH